MLNMCTQHMKIRGRPWLQSAPDFGPTYLGIIPLRIKVDAVGYPDEHVAVGDTVVLGHAHADTVASGVDHGFKVTGRGMPNLKKPKQGQPPHGTF